MSSVRLKMSNGLSVPNVLTVLRLFLTAIFIYFLYQNTLASILLATLVFTLASLTDYFDGYLARKYNAITDFGKVMDPIADKFLILSAFYLFADMQIFPFWMFVIIAIREIGITVLRLMAVKSGTVLAAEKSGKLKTVLQITAISIILLYLIFNQMDVANTDWLNSILAVFYPLIFLMMVLVVFVTLYSGMTFLWNNREHFHVR